MEISEIVDQVVDHLKDAPEKIKDVIADPKGTLEEITGQDLTDVDLGEIVDKVKETLGEKGIDVAGIVEGLGENIGDAVKGALEGIEGFFKKD